MAPASSAVPISTLPVVSTWLAMLESMPAIMTAIRPAPAPAVTIEIATATTAPTQLGNGPCSLMKFWWMSSLTVPLV